MCADFGDGKIEEIVTDKFITQVTIAFSRIVGKRFLADKLSPATVDYVLMTMVSGLPFEIKASTMRIMVLALRIINLELNLSGWLGKSNSVGCTHN